MNESKVAGGTPLLDLPQQRKPWSDLTDAERVEVLRREVRDLRRSLGWISGLALQAKALASSHEHARDGTPVFREHILSHELAQQATSEYDPLA